MMKIVLTVILVSLAGFLGYYYLNQSDTSEKKTMNITSRAFSDGDKILPKYTCDGENVNMPLSWDAVPAGAESFALIMDDPDIPDSVKKSLGMEVFVHWVLWNIPASTAGIEENSVPTGASQGLNSSGSNKYTGPCPPDREHRYFFKLYALDAKLDLPASTNKEDLLRAMDGHVLEETELVGLYERIK